MEELLEKLKKGELKLYEIEEFTKDVNKASEIRRKFLEETLKISLEYLGKYSIDLNLTYRKNIENAIGCVQIPLGIAGPLLVNGDYAKGFYYIPLATTEGALVASVNRGCSILTASEGVRTKILEDKMTRAPLFKVKNISRALEIVEWINEHFQELKEKFEEGSRHLKLKAIKPWIIGTNLWLRLEAETGDAMGMNMVTIASDRFAKFLIEKNPDLELVALSGNLCTDKKAGSINWLLGRGKSVIAEAFIAKEILENKLKVAPKQIEEVNNRKNILGSAFAHAYGLNAHMANVIAAIFLATGQDAAQITESSMGITYVEANDKGLYISVYLPSLEIGTVGGGTHLPTQREALRIMGCEGAGIYAGYNAKKFAEIIAGACLAGELSLLIALAKNELARSHEKLGRVKN
ncbi:MAG: hydroxymethylglutaryl-CoA reductase (NADPH) [Thermoproteota archaeon]|nr:hydroxymethylglutaryl-CoA reductase (NADPH) [Thermoproteota archaeon]